jgi:putative oxidoreductase
MQTMHRIDVGMRESNDFRFVPEKRASAVQYFSRRPTMKVLLWILQAALALLSLAGGAYKVFSFDELAKMPATGALSRGEWGALGVFEMLCGILLIVPAITKWKPGLAPFAAAALALESLALAVVYARYSLSLTATNPLVWVVAMAVMAVFVACGRYAFRSPA